MACAIAAVAGVFAYKAYQNKPENKFKRTVNEFEKQIKDEDYSKAKELIDIDSDVYGNFEDFAEKCLKGAKLKETKYGYTLTGDQGTYTLTSSEDGEKIVPTDFYMEIKVKCSTYLLYAPFGGCSTSEVLDDGMTLYTVKAYKAHDFEIESCVALGSESDMALQTATVEATTDDDYKVDDITLAYRFDDENNTYDGAYLDDDGTIVMDKYYISEDYAETVARTYSGFGTDMTSAVLNGESFEDFYAGYDGYIFDTDTVESEYNEVYKIRNTLIANMDYSDFTATSWNYPQEFRYSNGEYVLNVTVKNTIYKNSKEKGSSSGSVYVLFKPGKDRFKVFSISDNESDLYKSKEVSEDTDSSEADTAETDIADTDTADMKEWQQAYTQYLTDHQSEIGHASLGYLNGDDIPELFIADEENPSHGCSVQIYSYIDGQVKQVTAEQDQYMAFGSYGDVGYFEKTGIIVSMNSGMGVANEDYYKMNDDGTTETLLKLLGTDIDMPDKTKYYIEDSEVTEDEWNNARNQVVPDSQEMSNAPGDDYSAQDIINQISQWK